jgi:hypothetical protein
MVSFAARAPCLRFRDRPTCGPLCEAGVAKRMCLVSVPKCSLRLALAEARHQPQRRSRQRHGGGRQDNPQRMSAVVSKVIRLTMAIAQVTGSVSATRASGIDAASRRPALAIRTACNMDWTRGRVNKKLLIAFLPRPATML